MDASRQDKTMANTDSRVTIHMAASLDGFIARKDGRVDWLETSDEFAGGEQATDEVPGSKNYSKAASATPGWPTRFLKEISSCVPVSVPKNYLRPRIGSP